MRQWILFMCFYMNRHEIDNTLNHLNKQVRYGSWSRVPALLPSFKRKASKSFMKEQIKKGLRHDSNSTCVSGCRVITWSALEWGDHILNKLLLCCHIFSLIWSDRNPINLNIWATVLSYHFQSSQWKKILVCGLHRPPAFIYFLFAEDTDNLMLALALYFAAF